MNHHKDILLLSSMPVVDCLTISFKTIVYGCYAGYTLIRFIRYVRNKK